MKGPKRCAILSGNGRQLQQDQLRARHRLTKFLLRTGQRPPLGLKAWTERYMRWLAQVRYTQPAQEITLRDCLNEFEHMSARVRRLEEAILEVVKQAPQSVPGVDPWPSGSARRGTHLGSHDRIRVGQHLLPLRERTETDGLLRSFPE